MYRIKKELVLLVVLPVFVVFFMISSVSAQYWQAIPPYNMLWPLWSGVLSPEDPITGIPTPLVSSLTSTTQLPIAPVFVLDIGPDNISNVPYFLYNEPPLLGGGLIYYSQRYGFNPFPPPSFTTPEGIVPNILPRDYEYIIPGNGFLNFDIQVSNANLAYQDFFGGLYLRFFRGL